MQEIAASGKLPIIAGGSTFYLRAVMYASDASFLGDKEVRQYWQKVVEADHDWHTSLARLAKLDPERASKLLPNDVYDAQMSPCGSLLMLMNGWVTLKLSSRTCARGRDHHREADESAWFLLRRCVIIRQRRRAAPTGSLTI
mgnify:CR=1 FL=1